MSDAGHKLRDPPKLFVTGLVEIHEHTPARAGEHSMAMFPESPGGRPSAMAEITQRMSLLRPLVLDECWKWY